MAGINMFCVGLSNYFVSKESKDLNAFDTMLTVTKLLNLDASVVAST